MSRLNLDDINELISEGKTYEEMSNILQRRFPGQRGFSVRTIKRFCSVNQLSTVKSAEFIENEVKEAVDEVMIMTTFSLII